MELFQYSNYKELIREEAKCRDIRFNRLAKAARIQKSYLSHVLRRDAHLSDEQGYLIAKALQLGAEETSYLLLLLQRGRAREPELIRYFDSKLGSIRRKHSRLSQSLHRETRIEKPRADADGEEVRAVYYLDVRLQIAHMLLLVPKYQARPELLAEALDVTPSELRRILGTLRTLGLVEIRDGGVRVTSKLMHLEAGSALSEQNHLMWRHHAAAKRFSARRGDWRLSATITADAATKRELGQELQELFARFQRKFKQAADETVFQLNIDLYDA